MYEDFIDPHDENLNSELSNDPSAMEIDNGNENSTDPCELNEHGNDVNKANAEIDIDPSIADHQHPLGNSTFMSANCESLRAF